MMRRPTNSFLYNLVMDTYSFGYNASSFVDMPISHKVFSCTVRYDQEASPMKALALLVGRCADYALARYTRTACNLFIYADDDDVKTKRIMAQKYPDLNGSPRQRK